MKVPKGMAAVISDGVIDDGGDCGLSVSGDGSAKQQ